MIKSKYMKALMLGMCISALSYGVAFAETTNAKDGEMTIQIESSENESTVIESKAPYSNLADGKGTSSADSELANLQKKIDQYVFVDHYKDIEDKGFTVTQTGVVDNYVEVGITPYSEENAKYIYDSFGEDNIKVVEGVEAVMYATGAADDTAVSTEVIDDSLVQKQDEVNKILLEDKASEIEAKGITINHTTPMNGYIEVGISPYNEDNAAYIKSLIGEDMVQVIKGIEPELMATSGLAVGETAEPTTLDDEAAQMKIVSLNDSPTDDAANAAKNNILPIIGIAGVTILLGGIVLFSQKKKANR